MLDRAAALVKPGGRIVYITCSILPEENDDAVAAFLRRASRLHAGRSAARCWRRAELGSSRPLVRTDGARPAADAAQDRHRRLLRRGAARRTDAVTDRILRLLTLPSKAASPNNLP